MIQPIKRDRKEYMRLYAQKYRQTEKYKQFQKWYSKCAKRRAWLRSNKAKMRLDPEKALLLNERSKNYRQTDKYKKWYANYSQLPRVKESGRIRAKYYRLKKKEAQAFKEEIRTGSFNSRPNTRFTYQNA